jgi:hypothetical protein
MIELKDITGFVTCMDDNFWWLGCVLSVSEESVDVKESFIHGHGHSELCIYPATLHIQFSQTALLPEVSPNTAAGCIYTLTNEVNR